MLPRHPSGLPRVAVDADSAAWLRRGSLAAVVLQNTALALSMRYSRMPASVSSQEPGQEVPEELYLVTTAVFCGELLKLFVSCVLAMREETTIQVIRLFFSKDSVAMLVPAALYTLQNNLQYVAVSNLDVSVCQVLYQMKLVTTALFSVAMLGRSLSHNQWGGIISCAFGVALVQLSTLGGKGNTEASSGQQVWLGFLAVTVACITSGLAAVYTEKVFKSGTTSMWVRNMHLATWSMLAVSWGMFFADGPEIREKGFFVGYNSLVCIVIGLQALGGMAVALVAKYADNIAKGFATAISIVLTCIFSTLFLELKPSALFLGGTALVLSSLYLYSRGSTAGALQRVEFMDIKGRTPEDSP